MIILFLMVACFAVGTAAFFLMVMADGRRLRERVLEPRPRFMPEEVGPEAPLVTSHYAL